MKIKRKMRVQRRLMLVVPLLLIALSGLVYGSWITTVTKTYHLQTGYWPSIQITSYKKLTEQYWMDWATVTLDGDTLTINSEVCPGWYIWIGAVIHNEGPISVMFHLPDPPEVIDPDGVWPLFTHEEYFYGPYAQGDFAQEVWDGIKLDRFQPGVGIIDVDPIPYGEFPIELYDYYKVISWQYLHFSEEYTGPCFDIQITFTYTATEAPP